MKKRFRSFTAVLLAVIMITFMFSIIPAQAAIDENQGTSAISGTTGDCIWTLDEEGALTISGQGKMGDYFMYEAPWNYDLPWGFIIYSVVIENGVTSIGDFAFYGLSNCTSVTIPDSVTSIGNYAFWDCNNLTKVEIPDSVTNIGQEAFVDTSWYNNQPDGLVYAGKVAYKYKGKMPDKTAIALKDGTKGIADYAFFNCNNLTSIEIPDSVTSIGEYAFSGCTGLTIVTIPNSVTNIGDYAFGACTGLTSITIPDNVTSIGDSVFANCTNLTSIDIPNSVTRIGEKTFSFCDGLTSVTIGKNVRSIGDYAFYACTGLKNITIPDSVTSIGDMAFGYYYDYSIWEYKKVDGFSIYGVKGTAAEKYANDYGFDFIEIEPEEKKIIGDVNGDNSVDILDATVVQKYSAGKANLSEEQLEVGDVNGDNNVDILDATEIQKFAAGKITEFKKK